MLARGRRGCFRWCWKTRRRCCGRCRQCLRWCWQWRRICCGRCRQGGGGKKGKTKRWAAGVEAEDDQAEGDLHGRHQVGILLWKLFVDRFFSSADMQFHHWEAGGGFWEQVRQIWSAFESGNHVSWMVLNGVDGFNLYCKDIFLRMCLKQGPDFWLLQAILTPLCGSRPHQGKDYHVHLCHRHQDLWDNLLHHHPQQHCLTLSDLMKKKSSQTEVEFVSAVSGSSVKFLPAV